MCTHSYLTDTSAVVLCIAWDSPVYRLPGLSTAMKINMAREVITGERETDKSQLSKALLVTFSASFLAELSVRSPRKLFIFIIKKNIFWIKVSKNKII